MLEPEVEGMATQVLQEMADAGELHIPAPWTNDRGERVIAWDMDADGSALACYLDMLGLNGRNIRSNTVDGQYRDRRRMVAPEV